MTNTREMEKDENLKWQRHHFICEPAREPASICSLKHVHPYGFLPQLVFFCSPLTSPLQKSHDMTLESSWRMRRQKKTTLDHRVTRKSLADLREVTNAHEKKERPPRRACRGTKGALTGKNKPNRAVSREISGCDDSPGLQPT